MKEKVGGVILVSFGVSIVVIVLSISALVIRITLDAWAQ